MLKYVYSHSVQKYAKNYKRALVLKNYENKNIYLYKSTNKTNVCINYKKKKKNLRQNQNRGKWVTLLYVQYDSQYE